jgi:hypothetical protein
VSVSKVRLPLAEPFERLGTHWFVFMLIVVLPMLAIWGQLLSGYGLPLLFRDDETLFEKWTNCWEEHRSVATCVGPYLISFINSPTFYTHGAATFFAGLFWLFAAIIEPRTDRYFMERSFWQEAKYILIRTLPIAVINLLGAIYALHLYEFSLPHNFNELSANVARSQLLRIIAGDIMAVPLIALFAESSRQIAKTFKLQRRFVLYAMLFLFIVSLHFFPKLVPIVSIFKLAATIAGIYLLINFFKTGERFWIFAALLLILIVGSAKKYKYTLPGLTDEYNCPVILKEHLGALPEEPTGKRCGGKEQPIGDAPSLLTPTAALDAFSARLPERYRSAAGRRLVVLATSGGAYRATFWTALVLDRLREMSVAGKTPGLAQHIRLVTGASGGMVGGAYFVALKPDQIEQIERKDTRLTEIIKGDIDHGDGSKPSWTAPLPRDSLSDLLQQLATWDILHTILPVSVEDDTIAPSRVISFRSDRGRTLQADWATLDQSFEAHTLAVKGGLAPSIIFSPMIAETGQPLLISDLDLKNIEVEEPTDENASGYDHRQHKLEFFKVFPNAFGKFTLQTAARINAAFPIISPAVDLPIDPPRRVVDAGYFDNYGMVAALMYLRSPEVRDWMQKNGLKGALIIQINAFPTLKSYPVPDNTNTAHTACADDSPSEPSQWLEWLATPLQGVASARERGMIYRVEQALWALQEIYDRDQLKLDRVAFENTARASFSWYLPGSELSCMEQDLKQPHNQQEFERLERIWNG